MAARKKILVALTIAICRETVVVEEKEEASQTPATTVPVTMPRANEFHYNIQIHLPATNDISVYNAIFKSLKDNLLM